MQSHENDLLINPESHQAPARRKDAAESAGPEALMHGRTDVLTPSAVMHLQKTAGNATVTAALEEQEASPVKDVVGSGGGSPLDRDTRGFMESRLGADFSDVRVHTGGKATESARSVQAHAYTVGNDVVFQSDKYAPESDSGKRMLAHELTHLTDDLNGKLGDMVGSVCYEAEVRAFVNEANFWQMVNGPLGKTSPDGIELQENAKMFAFVGNSRFADLVVRTTGSYMKQCGAP